MSELTSLIELLAQPRKIVITTHHKPDGDAMGSSLGLYHYLVQLGHHTTVIAPTDYPEFLHWMPGNENVVVYTENTDLSATLVAEAEIVFCLDFNALTRINELGEVVRHSSAIKVMIDHHLDPEDFDDYRYWDINACATAQLIHGFIVKVLGGSAYINKDVATCLYTGIMTDSGSFRFPNVTSDVHRIVADLMDHGAVNWQIHELVYNNASENALRLLGHCLDKMIIIPEYRTALFSVSKEELKQYNIGTGDTEGIVNYGLNIAGMRLAAFIVERDDKVKLSLRSKGEVPANEICRKYFNGGGHRNAAGGHSTETLEQTIEKFKSILPEYKGLLLL